MRLRSVVLAAPLAGALVVAARDARAGAAWGDASLTRDDVRIQLGTDGRAEVTHTIAIHVAAKRFKAFVIDGVDAGLTPPDDDVTKAGLDGPGWPATAVDAKGTTLDALVEPAKEPRRLRVRLGLEGVPRGDYTITLRYRVDLSRAFSRDGAMLRFTWSSPRWPEGYDAAKIVLAVPSAPTAPKVAIGEPGVASAHLTGLGAGPVTGDDAEHDAEGVALVSVSRGPTFDEVEIDRPHVPQLDDTRWIFRVDPKALPGVAAPLGAATPDDGGGATHRPSLVEKGSKLLAAGLAGLALALILRRRDAAAEEATRALGTEFRPIVALPPTARAAAFGVASSTAIAGALMRAPLASAAGVIVALGLATLRAPLPSRTTRAPGRWLAIPRSAVPGAERKVISPLDPGGTAGAVLASVVALCVAAAAILVARIDARAAIALLVDAAILVPLFLTGRGAQLPKDRVGDAWSVLARLEPAIASAAAAFGAKTKIVARTAKSSEAPTIDELRLRVDPASRDGVRSIEIGCAISHSAAGSALIPEILVRVDDAVAEAVAQVDSDAIEIAVGRTDDERVLAVRPADASPATVSRWISWALSSGRARAVTRAPTARSERPARAAATVSP